jgi:diadenosine tetraphosphate (Ap4A) HIT family hydrolase
VAESLWTTRHRVGAGRAFWVTPERAWSATLIVVPKTSPPPFTEWSSFPFEGELRVKTLDAPVAVEPPRIGEDGADCPKCHAPDEAYIWVNENWRVRAPDRPSGLPMVLILESRSHLDLGDLPNMLAAELGVMTVRLERAVRSLDGVARVHVNRWGDGAAHLHLWFLARPQGQLQLRGPFLTLWDEVLPPIAEAQWRENLALIAAWLAEFGGQPLAQPPRIEWKAPSSLEQLATVQIEPEVVAPAPGATGDGERANAPAARDGERAAEAAPGAAGDGDRAAEQGREPESAAKNGVPEPAAEKERPGAAPGRKPASAPPARKPERASAEAA